MILTELELDGYQKKVLNGIVQGMTTPQIATQMKLSTPSTESIIYNLMVLLNFKTRTQLACWYVQNYPNDCPKVLSALDSPPGH